jgi:hypothetical protein
MSRKPSVKFRQCRLAKRTGNANYETVSWLPVEFPVKEGGSKARLRVGSVVDLREDDGTWSEDWTVVSVGAELEDPPDWRKLIKGHRKMTGDSNPRHAN